ncbi:MAG: type III-B CRISPR module RAMP protein Cmr4 [Proteobacteria bacterium]|nr:type III-B CRISPR module RAMP protein Cmr4 [Pseudomonadota bacterium]
MHSRLYLLHALSALHAGTGQGSGVIDLPIAREKSTGLPIVPGSSIKGVLRDEFKGDSNVSAEQHQALFGPDTENAADHAGALALSDARLLCLPVRSLAGTFAWVTCPLVLHRFKRDLQAVNPGSCLAIPKPDKEKIEVCPDSALIDNNNMVLLEDLDLSAKETDESKSWAELIGLAVFGFTDWKKLFEDRFAIVDDAMFDFLAETATEIVTRIRIQENTRTVAQGGLWFEEHLPAESLLWGVAACDRSRYDKVESNGADLLRLLHGEKRLQVGGKASVGRGQARWLLAYGQNGRQPA